MSEIRRKLVIVGDGACGKVRQKVSSLFTCVVVRRKLDSNRPLLRALGVHVTLTPPLASLRLADLSPYRLLQGHIPRGK